MSTLTGNDVMGLMEAYQAVYAPQELTEEQVWEEVEEWVNTLIEEGYDLSDYTWEEMYESYIEEQDKATNIATWAKANPKLAAAAAERERTRGTSATTNPLMKDLKSRLPAPSPTPAPSAAPKPTPRAPKPTPAATPRAATPRAATPATPAPAAAVTPAPAAAKPMTAFQAAGGNAKLAQLNKGKSPRQGRDTASTIEKQGQDNLFKSGGGNAAIAKGPTTTRNVRGGGTQKVPTLNRQDIINRGSSAATLKQSFEYDAYDLVLEYLLSQGHADTLEEANYVMLELDAEMIGSIIEAKVDEKLPEHKRSGARLNRYDNPSGALALGGGQQRARREEHKERRGKKTRG